MSDGGSAASGPQGPDKPRALLTVWAAEPGRGVIFDFNGTLSDDEPLLLRIFTELFHDHLQWNLTPEHYYAYLAGLSDREIIDTVVRQAAPGCDELIPTLLSERRRRYRALAEARSPIRPLAVALVRMLIDAGVPVGIVTGAQRTDVDFVLEHSDLRGMIKAITTEEDVVRGKPDPEGFRIGAARLGLATADVLVFEDSVPGLVAARAAGMRCVALTGTGAPDELARAADVVIDALEPGLFDGLLGG